MQSLVWMSTCQHATKEAKIKGNAMGYVKLTDGYTCILHWSLWFKCQPAPVKILSMAIGRRFNLWQLNGYKC